MNEPNKSCDTNLWWHPQSRLLLYHLGQWERSQLRIRKLKLIGVSQHLWPKKKKNRKLICSVVLFCLSLANKPIWFGVCREPLLVIGSQRKCHVCCWTHMSSLLMRRKRAEQQSVHTIRIRENRKLQSLGTNMILVTLSLLHLQLQEAWLTQT